MGKNIRVSKKQNFQTLQFLQFSKCIMGNKVRNLLSHCVAKPVIWKLKFWAVKCQKKAPQSHCCENIFPLTCLHVCLTLKHEAGSERTMYLSRYTSERNLASVLRWSFSLYWAENFKFSIKLETFESFLASGVGIFSVIDKKNPEQSCASRS